MIDQYDYHIAELYFSGESPQEKDAYMNHRLLIIERLEIVSQWRYLARRILYGEKQKDEKDDE